MYFTARALMLSLFANSAIHILFWIWHQLNLSRVPYDDQINGLTVAFPINTANWPYSKVLNTISFLFKILTNMSQVRNGNNFIILPTLNAFL